VPYSIASRLRDVLGLHAGVREAVDPAADGFTFSPLTGNFRFQIIPDIV
jgi:hypothetical protein